MENLMKDHKHERDARTTTKPATDADAAVQKELQREEGEGKDLIGDEAKNRNLSGSSTWETLPDPTPTDG
jgi:hypothetical protein